MFSSRGNAIENLAIQRLVLLNQYIIELMIVAIWPCPRRIDIGSGSASGKSWGTLFESAGIETKNKTKKK